MIVKRLSLCEQYGKVEYPLETSSLVRCRWRDAKCNLQLSRFRLRWVGRAAPVGLATGSRVSRLHRRLVSTLDRGAVTSRWSK